MKKIVPLLVVVVALALLNGCVLFVAGGAAAAGAGTVAYMNGVLKDTEAHSLDAVHDATLEAVKDLQFALVSDTKDGIHVQIIARTATDTKIEIVMEKQSAELTEIQIRVGTFGDEKLSRQILEKIKLHL